MGDEVETAVDAETARGRTFARDFSSRGAVDGLIVVGFAALLLSVVMAMAVGGTPGQVLLYWHRPPVAATTSERTGS